MNQESASTSEIIPTKVERSLVSIDSTVRTPFKPTAAMRVWVAASVNLKTTAVSKIAEECGQDRKNWYVWLKKPGFLEWYDQEREKAMALVRAQLDAIGMEMAKKDFRYFKLMQKIAGRDVSEESALPINPPGSPVQVNFNSNKYIKDRE